MPETRASSDLERVLDLFLHELRAPVGAAQGYLRLLLENRLNEPNDRRRALAQSAVALDRIGDLCASAGEYLNIDGSAELTSYPAAELSRALQAECDGKELAVYVQKNTILGHIHFLTPPDAATTLAAVLQAALRSDPTLTRAVHLGVHGADLVLTTGDEAVRDQLLESAERDPFDQWQGGNGLRVLLALKHLTQTGTRMWTLPQKSGAVAIAIPMESPA